MSGLGSSPLASVDDVDPHKSPQSLDEHQFVHAELVEPDPDPDPVPDSKAAPAATKSKRNIILASGAVLLLFVAAAVVGGVCGTGMCSSDKSTTSINSTPVDKMPRLQARRSGHRARSAAFNSVIL